MHPWVQPVGFDTLIFHASLNIYADIWYRDVTDEIRYARGVYELCKSMNILFIADEVRQGAGKTGQFFSFQHLGDDVKPDIVTMGKSITGGFYPQSFIMGLDTVMASVGPYEMASTYGFSPLAIAAANATIDVIDRENLVERAVHLGYLWNHPLVDYVAQIGADSNLILRGVKPSRVAALCMHRGLFVYPKANGIRLRRWNYFGVCNEEGEEVEKGRQEVSVAVITAMHSLPIGKLTVGLHGIVAAANGLGQSAFYLVDYEVLQS